MDKWKREEVMRREKRREEEEEGKRELWKLADPGMESRCLIGPARSRVAQSDDDDANEGLTGQPASLGGELDELNVDRHTPFVFVTSLSRLCLTKRTHAPF